MISGGLCTVPDYVYEMNMIGNYLAFCTSYDFMSFAGADTVNYSNPINFYVFDLKKIRSSTVLKSQSTIWDMNTV